VDVKAEFGNGSLELGTGERMVLDVYCESLLGRIQSRFLWHGPTLEDAVGLQPENHSVAATRIG
jgi:hypothetical protein